MPVKVTTPYMIEQDKQAAAQRVRQKLPGQVAQSRRALAEAQYGLAMSQRELHDKIRRSIRARFGFERSSSGVGITSYTRFIPDEALLKYQEAKDSGFFDRFTIEWPTYDSKQAPDPYLVGWLDGDTAIVLAYWDDDELHPKREAIS